MTDNNEYQKLILIVMTIMTTTSIEEVFKRAGFVILYTQVIDWLNPEKLVYHDDVIQWRHFPRYWPFDRGIHRVTCEFPAQRPVTRSFDIFFDLRLNKQLSKQSWGWWFETPSH